MAFTEITPEEININPFTSWSRYVLVTAGNIRKVQYASRHMGRLRRHVEKENRHHLHPTEPFTKTILDSQDYSPCHSFRRNTSRR